MVNDIRIIIDKNIKDTKYNFEISLYTPNNYELIIYTDGTKSFDELISDRKTIDGLISDQGQFIYNLIDHTCNVRSLDDILNSLSYIILEASGLKYDYENDSLDYSIEEPLSNKEKANIVHDYLMKYPEYKDKSILIPDYIDLKTNIEDIKKKYEGFKSLYVRPYGESTAMLLEEAKVGTSLNDLINSLKQLNLSPLEYSILVYDLVREKSYLHEGKDELAAESRDTYRALTGDSIVCAGYANIYSTIMQGLGIRCDEVLLNGFTKDEPGHARNSIYLNDPKYGVKGIFFLDATHDSRDATDVLGDYLYKYTCFLKKKDFFKNSDRHNRIYDFSYRGIDTFGLNNLDEMLDLARNEKIDYTDIPKWDAWLDARRALSNIVTLYQDYDYSDEDKNVLVDTFLKYKDEFLQDWNSRIELSTFMKALMYVRNIENMIDPIKYPLNYNKIYQNMNLYKFRINEDRLLNYESDAVRMIKIIFGVEDEQEEHKELTEEEKGEIIARNFKEELQTEMLKIKKDREDGKYKVVSSLKLYSRGKKNVKK